MPEITSVDGVARHSQIIRLPAPPSLLVDNNCRRAGTKQMGARGEAQGIRWYNGLHGQNSARGKFRTSPRKMRGKFRTKLKYGIFPAEKSPRGISPPPVSWHEVILQLLKTEKTKDITTPHPDLIPNGAMETKSKLPVAQPNMHGPHHAVRIPSGDPQSNAQSPTEAICNHSRVFSIRKPGTGSSGNSSCEQQQGVGMSSACCWLWSGERAVCPSQTTPSTLSFRFLAVPPNAAVPSPGLIQRPGTCECAAYQQYHLLFVTSICIGLLKPSPRC